MAVVMVAVPLLPGVTETEVGEPAMVNAGAGAVTVKETAVIFVIPPPVPVTVTV